MDCRKELIRITSSVVMPDAVQVESSCHKNGNSLFSLSLVEERIDGFLSIHSFSSRSPLWGISAFSDSSISYDH